MNNNDHNDQEQPPPLPPGGIVWVAIIFEAALVVVALALGWLVGIEPFGRMVTSLDSVVAGLAATAPMLMLLWWGLSRREGLVGNVAHEAAQMSQQFFGRASAAELALVSLGAGFGEEALFRGVLQPLFAQFGGEVVGLVAASVLFGMAHAMSRAYAVIATIVGLYLGWLYVYFDNLMVPVVAHAAYDFVALAWLRRVRV